MSKKNNKKIVNVALLSSSLLGACSSGGANYNGMFQTPAANVSNVNGNQGAGNNTNNIQNVINNNNTINPNNNAGALMQSVNAIASTPAISNNNNNNKKITDAKDRSLVFLGCFKEEVLDKIASKNITSADEDKQKQEVAGLEQQITDLEGKSALAPKDKSLKKQLKTAKSKHKKAQNQLTAMQGHANTLADARLIHSTLAKSSSDSAPSKIREYDQKCLNEDIIKPFYGIISVKKKIAVKNNEHTYSTLARNHQDIQPLSDDKKDLSDVLSSEGIRIYVLQNPNNMIKLRSGDIAGSTDMGNYVGSYSGLSVQLLGSSTKVTPSAKAAISNEGARYVEVCIARGSSLRLVPTLKDNPGHFSLTLKEGRQGMGSIEFQKLLQKELDKYAEINPQSQYGLDNTGKKMENSWKKDGDDAAKNSSSLKKILKSAQDKKLWLQLASF